MVGLASGIAPFPPANLNALPLPFAPVLIVIARALEGHPEQHLLHRLKHHARDPALPAPAPTGHRIRALAGRRFRPCTTDSRHHLAVAPNLLAQRFDAPAPNRVWLADISYIATGEGWLYLAVVLDLATRKVVGWAEQPKVPAVRSIAGMAAEGMRDHMRVPTRARGADDGGAATEAATGAPPP